MKAKILLVEDDPGLGFVIKDSLIHAGYDVTLCINGEEGEKSFVAHPYDLCVLDVMMPLKDGFSLAQAIRQQNKNIPILFITAKGMLEDKLVGFQSGGDDYLVKPFSIEELKMRIEVFLKRPQKAEGTVNFNLGNFVFDSRNLVLTHPASTKTLTQKEAEVLKLLCQHQDRVIKRDEILKQVWGDDDYFLGRSMDVFISKLRKYLKEDERVQIVNHHGVGFRLEVR